MTSEKRVWVVAVMLAAAAAAAKMEAAPGFQVAEPAQPSRVLEPPALDAEAGWEASTPEETPAAMPAARVLRPLQDGEGAVYLVDLAKAPQQEQPAGASQGQRDASAGALGGVNSLEQPGPLSKMFNPASASGLYDDPAIDGTEKTRKKRTFCLKCGGGGYGGYGGHGGGYGGHGGGYGGHGGGYGGGYGGGGFGGGLTISIGGGIRGGKFHKGGWGGGGGGGGCGYGGCGGGHPGGYVVQPVIVKQPVYVGGGGHGGGGCGYGGCGGGCGHGGCGGGGYGGGGYGGGSYSYSQSSAQSSAGSYNWGKK